MPLYTLQVAEKGFAWLKLKIKGKPGHGSTPHGEDVSRAHTETYKLSLSLALSHTHTLMLAHTHARTHTCTHTHN